ncbi:MAG: hypothetical protein V1708_05810 [Candidatus Micrarchaeota archaeon]
MISKTAIASLLLGLVVMAGTYLYAFQSAGPWIMLVVAVQGGVILLGALLVFLGLLMLVV